MECIVNFNSGNYALELFRILEKQGYAFELISTPCHIASSGCGYSIKIPAEYKEMVIREGLANGIKVNAVYEIIPGYTRNKYKLVY